MKISFNTFVNQTLSVLTVCMILPLAAQADQVVVADANGNQLIYSYDGADGPATFTGVKTYAAEEDKAGHIIIADNVTDANSNSHEVKYIGGSTSNRGNIKSIVFGQNIIAVGGPEGTSGDAFYNCQKLESVTLNSKLEILGKWAFQNCNKLENVNLGEATSLKTIMIKAFQNADRIRSLELPESVTLLEESVFEGCDSLRTFTFLGTSQITNIPYNCFVSCISLERITLPDAVETLSTGCFYNTPKLVEITFGTGITSLSDDYTVFGYHDALKKMVFPGSTCPFVREYHLSSELFIYVRPDMLNTYRENNYTKNLRILALGESTTYDLTTTAGGQLQVKMEAQGDANNVIELSVTGPINGTDIDYLHSALPNLTVLDLTNARIVSGGDSYHRWDVSNNGTASQYSWSGPWNTENDVVGPYMFYNMPMLTSLSLPSGATSIGECALAQEQNHNFKLSHISLPAGLTSIGRAAFIWTGITEVTIPNGITAMDRDVFYRCEKLKKATLPDSLKTIGIGTFNGCYALEDVNMPSTVESIDDYAFCDNQKRTSPLVIPGTCKRIGHQAFLRNYLLPSVVFNEGLETVGNEAFRDCHLIKQAELPESVTELGYTIFYDCDSLRTFTFPQNIKVVPNNILQHCDALTSVTLADGTTSIGYASFADCPLLNTMNYNQETLTSLDYYAFSNTGFTSLTLPNSIISIGDWVCYNCKNLTSVNIPTGIDHVPYSFAYGCPQLINVTMHDGIRTIKGNAFRSCTLLPTIELNDQITRIENDAFRECKNLVLDKLPDALTYIGGSAFRETPAITAALTIPEGVTEIAGSAFNGSGISSITLPDGLTVIGEGIVAYTPNLSNIKLPATIRRIPNYTFQKATALEHINLPATVREIGYCAFEQSALAEITLPDSIAVVENYAFSRTNLQTFRVPDAFTSDLGSWCLYDCKHLKSVYFGRNQDYSQWQSFTCCSGCDSLQLMRIYAGTPPKCETYHMGYRTRCVLEVPEDQVDLFKEADGWKEFKEIIGFFSGDVLNDQDYALLQTLYQTLDGANWTTPWDLTNNHHATGKWAGITTENKGGDTYYITAIDLPASGLKGQLTADVFQLSRLQTLDLSENEIGGNIGTLFSGITSELAPLTEINLKGNQFTGDLYPFASKLPELTKLDVSFNRLTAISQPISNEKLKSYDFNYNFQFIDYHTHEVVECDDSVVTDINIGIPTKLTLNTLMTYRHDQQDHGFTSNDLARIHYDGYWYNPWDTYWELYQTDGLWNLYKGDNNYVFSGPKNKVQAYVLYNGNWQTMLLRMNWIDGDVNADQDIDVTDLQSVIHYTLNDQKANDQMFNFTAADANNDNAIDVRDIVGSIDYILGYEQPANAKRYGASQNTETAVLDAANKLSVNHSTVQFDNAEAVAALQLFICGTTKRDINVTSAIRNKFSVSMRDVAGGVRIVIYSADGLELLPGQHDIISNLPAGATVTEVRLSDKEAHHLGVSISHPTTGIKATETNQQSDVWYHLDGRAVNGKPLQSGIYINNGRKIIVK